MATSTQQNLRSCTICTEDYSTTGLKTPKLLECLHTFCQECLGKLVMNQGGNLVTNNERYKISCPICRTETTGNPNDLPTNTLAVRLLNAQHNPRNETTTHVFHVLRSSLQNAERIRTALEVLDSDLQISEKFNMEHLKVALNCLELYHKQPKRDYSVETASSSFITHLLQFSGGNQIPPETLVKIASETINVMTAFDFGEELKENCVSILLCNRVLEESVFDYSKVVEILLTSLPTTNSESLKQKMLKLVHEISMKMTAQQKNSVSTAGHVQSPFPGTGIVPIAPIMQDKCKDMVLVTGTRNLPILLRFVREQMTSRNFNQELTMAMKLISNMVFQRPCLRHKIATVGSLETFRELLKATNFPNDAKHSAVVVLTNCTYEPACRKTLLKDVLLLESLRQLLSSNSMLSYGSAFVLSALLQESHSMWTEHARSETLRDTVSTELYTAVLSWNASVQLGIDFNSMNHFSSLLRESDTPSIQLFAAWSVYRLCATNESYRSMVISGDCVQALTDCTETSTDSPEDVKKLAELTLKLLLK